MTASKDDSKQLASDLANSLRSTTMLMESLLGEIHDNATSLAILKERIEALGENVSILSTIVRDDNGSGSLTTRMVVIERIVTNLETNFKELKDFVSDSLDEMEEELNESKINKEKITEAETNFNRQRFIEKVKLAAAIIPGLIALSVVIIQILSKWSENSCR